MLVEYYKKLRTDFVDTVAATCFMFGIINIVFGNIISISYCVYTNHVIFGCEPVWMSVVRFTGDVLVLFAILLLFIFDLDKR